MHVVGEIQDDGKNDGFHLFVRLLLGLLFRQESLFDQVCFPRGLIGILLLAKRAVSKDYLIAQPFVDTQVDPVHAVCRPGLQLNLVDDILVNVHEAISGLLGVGLATNSLLEDVVLSFHSHIVVAESPPAVQLAVEYERVVVAAISSTIMH
jgi:hypothetical protein